MLPKIIQAGNRTEIRIMDKLMRQANAAYPRISPYRVNMRVHPVAFATYILSPKS